jgi:hypothetical protein
MIDHLLELMLFEAMLFVVAGFFALHYRGCLMNKEDLDKLAREIAEDDSVQTLEGQCPSRIGLGHKWYDTIEACDGSQRDVNRAVRYLEALGLLVRHPVDNDLARVLYEEPPAPPKGATEP